MSNIHRSTMPDLPLRAIPPLTALLAFERAASQLSFRRAARDLALSPSAISHQIRGLEALFGMKLFVRGARSVRLTTDGARYLAKVSGALTALHEVGREMLRHRRDRGGELWISALPFLTSTVLIPALADFKRRNPELMLRIEATHQYADFNSSPVDVAIRYGREHSTGLKFEPLDRGQGLAGLRACANQRRPAQARRFVPPGSDLPDVTATRLATVAQAGRDCGNDPAVSFGSTASRRCCRPRSRALASRSQWHL
jgi:LysR family glycine cleavage system transcriptional activator